MGDRVLYEFEFNLRRELISKLLAVEPFSEKWDFKNSENRISGQGDGAKLESCFMHHSLVIDKTSNDESKLVVKIYNVSRESESKDNQSQTNQIETKNERLQTNTQTFVSCRIQVQPYMQNHKTQTTLVSVDSVEVQTNESRLHSDFVHKAIESDFNLGTQSHRSVEMIPETVEAESQATAEMVDNGCQNVAPLASIELQTELIVSSIEVQTDIKRICDGCSQTSSSIACEAEASVQAACETKEQESQVVLCSIENISQTDMSMASQKDSNAQATVNVETQDSQTEIATSEMHTETEFNLATQCHIEAQSFIESSDVSFQTESHQAMDSGCITNHNLSTQESKDAQTGFDDVKLNDISATDNTSGCLNLDSSILDNSQDLSNISQVNGSYVDRVSQTDPVTIIIGDASFLVQKLKSSAMNASKVTTSGNEIEIELSADMVDQEIHEKEKPQTLAKVIPLEIKPATPEVIQPPSRVAASRVGGVRMRMPVSTASYAPNPSKAAQSFQARVPNATSVVSPQLHKTPQASHQNKPSTGLFSCPFCSLCFIESPALYEHLSDSHQSDLKSKWKKSQGREGKTIIPRNSQQVSQSNRKPNVDMSKSLPGRGNTASKTPENIAWNPMKRKKLVANISRKYRRIDDEEDEDDDDDDDEDYYDGCVRPARGGRM